MKITKAFVSILTVELPCTCTARREFKDNNFKEPSADHTFTFCETHREAQGSDIIKMVLQDRLDDEAKAANEPPPMQVKLNHPLPEVARPRPNVPTPTTGVRIGTNIIEKGPTSAARPLPSRGGIKRAT